MIIRKKYKYSYLYVVKLQERKQHQHHDCHRNEQSWMTKGKTLCPIIMSVYGHYIGHIVCQVAFSLLSKINQSAYSTLEYSESEQYSEFDRVVYIISMIGNFQLIRRQLLRIE